MSKFGIMSPKLGLQDGYPSVLMSTAFMVGTTRNIHTRDGLFQRIPGRLPSLVDEDSVRYPLEESVTGMDIPRSANHEGSRQRKTNETGNER